MRYSILLVALAACSSTTSDTATTAAPEPESAEAPEAPAESPPAERRCSAQMIRRAGLDTRTPECVDGVERLGNLPSSSFECSDDSDCSIFMAARGCLGFNLATSAHATTEPLYAACIADDSECGSADFSDHQTECRDGCCVIFEQ